MIHSKKGVRWVRSLFMCDGDGDGWKRQTLKRPQNGSQFKRKRVRASNLRKTADLGGVLMRET